MAHVRLRFGQLERGGILLASASALFFACAPSSGTGRNQSVQSSGAGRAAAGLPGGGAPPNAGAAAGVSGGPPGQGGVTGAGGIVPQGGFGNGGFRPRSGRFLPN